MEKTYYIEKKCYRNGKVSWVPMQETRSRFEQFARGSFFSFMSLKGGSLGYRVVEDSGVERTVLCEG